METIGKIERRGKTIISVRMDVSQDSDLDVLYKVARTEFYRLYPGESLLGDDYLFRWDKTTPET